MVLFIEPIFLITAIENFPNSGRVNLENSRKIDFENFSFEFRVFNPVKHGKTFIFYFVKKHEWHINDKIYYLC